MVSHVVLDEARFEPYCGETAHYSYWRNKTDDIFNEDPDVRSFADFVRIYVPSSVPYQKPTSEIAGIFDVAKQAVDPRDKSVPLCRGLCTLAEDFPPTKTLRFKDVNVSQYWFPPEEGSRGDTRRMPLAKPDLVAFLPGMEQLPRGPVDIWSTISLIVDIRDESSPDHLASGHPDAVRARMRLIRFAGHHLANHNALCSFVLSVRGSQMRVYRFDHAGCIVSPALDYAAEPDMLRQFLWSFVHPPTNTQFLGLDEYCTWASSEDLRWAQRVSRDAWDIHDVDSNRWIKFPFMGWEVEFLTLRIRSMSDVTFGGATCVWEALKRGDESGKRYIIKDTWQPFTHQEEKRFYECIRRPDWRVGRPTFGVAGYVHGLNYGLVTRMGEHSLHRTESARLRRGIRDTMRGERCHVRIVTDTVGKNLNEFERSRELIEAIRDAIKGHLHAYETGVLHADISNGNVLIARDKPFKGFIHDFDISAWIDSSADGGAELPPALRDLSQKQLRLVMGTPRFMAIEIFESIREPIVRNAGHDLQSFYWVTLCQVLECMDYYTGDLNKTIHDLFVTDNWVAMTKNKRAWLARDPHGLFSGNDPLAFLMRRLHELVSKSIRSYSNPDPIRLTHQSILAVFDEALAMDGWPEDDRSLTATSSVRLEERPDATVAAAGPSAPVRTGPPPQEMGQRAVPDSPAVASGPVISRKRARESDEEWPPLKRLKYELEGPREVEVPADQRAHPKADTGSASTGARGGEKSADVAQSARAAAPKPTRKVWFWRSLLRR